MMNEDAAHQLLQAIANNTQIAIDSKVQLEALSKVLLRANPSLHESFWIEVETIRKSYAEVHAHNLLVFNALKKTLVKG